MPLYNGIINMPFCKSANLVITEFCAYCIQIFFQFSSSVPEANSRSISLSFTGPGTALR